MRWLDTYCNTQCVGWKRQDHQDVREYFLSKKNMFNKFTGDIKKNQKILKLLCSFDFSIKKTVSYYHHNKQGTVEWDEKINILSNFCI